MTEASKEAKPTFYELLAKRYTEPPKSPALFKVGQLVRVRVRVVEDGQTPKFWAGASAVVQSRRCSGLHKEWSYELRHENGAVDSFVEWEIDRRYARHD